MNQDSNQGYEASVEMEYVTCQICGSEERGEVASRPDLFLGGARLYHMVECQGCGAVYQYPRPTAGTIGNFYPPQYQQYTPSVQAEPWLRRLDRRYGLRKRCHVITRHVPSGRLLDVGCATGDFLSEMKLQPGWSVVGLEPNRVAARYARAHVDVEVIDGLLDEAPFTSATFDAITMWDVLEHVHDPRAVIAEAGRLLRPGGVLVVNHPNLKSIDRRLFGRFWVGYELPRHLYLYPMALLRRLMSEYELHEVDLRCLYGSHAASGTSIMLMLEAYLPNASMKQAIRRLFFSKICRILLVPYFSVVDHFRRGSNILAVFKKP